MTSLGLFLHACPFYLFHYYYLFFSVCLLLWVPMLGNDANNANFQGSSKAQLNEKHFYISFISKGISIHNTSFIPIDIYTCCFCLACYGTSGDR